MRKAGRRRSWHAPFHADLSRADIGQEILAGVMGWQTVVTSLEFYASLFVSGDDSDKHATAEIFMLIAGVSTMAFGLATNLPFIVAPSVLYARRQNGITMGGQLAAQALANAAAALVFWFALKLKLVSYIPTALRIGAGYGVAILVGVLGMRNVGLLVADSFVLSAITWESVVGLAVITAASTTTSQRLAVKKWVYVLGVPTVVTAMVYALIDMPKFQGYALADKAPLSNWRGGSFGLVDFPVMLDNPGLYTFYIVRTFISIVINISSVLLVLVDTVCLQGIYYIVFLDERRKLLLKFRGVVKSAEDTDYSDAIGGTDKFRRMACAIPLMSFVGNLLGVTTEAAFVQSMIVVFAGGKTGLSTVVTGSLFILSTVIWPLLPVLVPSHISGALTIVITLRFFTAVRVIDVSRAENHLMFGVSILLIPFSFDFVDALCVATTLGFICTVSNKTISRGRFCTSVKVAVSINGSQMSDSKSYNPSRRGLSHSISRTKIISTVDESNSSSQASLSIPGNDHFPPGSPLPLRMSGLKSASQQVPRHKSLPNIPMSFTAMTPFENEEAKLSENEEKIKKQPFCHLPRRFSRYKENPSCSDSKETSHGGRLSVSSASSSSSRSSILGGLRRVKVGMRSKRIQVGPIQTTGKHGGEQDEAESSAGQTVHWKLALIAMVELVLKVINDQRQI